jgi:hypothetical protein
VYVKRVLAAASIFGAVGLPISFLGATVACADPASETTVGASGQPLPTDPAADGRQNQNKQSSTSGDAGAILPSNIGDEIARGLSQLPPPNLSGLPAPQLNVPVNIGLPGLGLVPDLSVPIVLGGIAAPQLPAFQLPPIAPPQIAPPQFPPLPF